MNAYKLADELHEDLQWIVTSNTDLPSRLASAINMLRQQADRIAELEKYVGFKESGYDIIQLTPQTKPLSDEEIKQIWYNLYPLSSSSYWDDKREGLAELKFARAILRKAQEK